MVLLLFLLPEKVRWPGKTLFICGLDGSMNGFFTQTGFWRLKPMCSAKVGALWPVYRHLRPLRENYPFANTMLVFVFKFFEKAPDVLTSTSNSILSSLLVFYNPAATGFISNGEVRWDFGIHTHCRSVAGISHFCSACSINPITSRQSRGKGGWEESEL